MKKSLGTDRGDDKGGLIVRVALILVLGLIFFPFGAYGSSPSSRSIERLFGKSTAVIAGKVVGISGSCPETGYCNPIYVVSLGRETMSTLKSPGVSLVGYDKFCSNVQLEMGQTYMVFLESASEFNTGDSKKCPLVVDLDGVFEKIGSDVYRVGSPEAQVLVDFEGNKYLTNAVFEPDFENLLESLSGAKGLK
ncbi:hypothetical protein [Xanthomonas indica]|uniref:Uncharacterized protein n=1 Tax=Xanthomonas indica TaxID=2912242 RepID=A0AAU8IAM5_9XANT|nr:hypothetical protein [Xanthomonas indica]MCI2260287.1 hypothetical protein [Xanthomonas indica]